MNVNATHGLEDWLARADVEAFHAQLGLAVEPPSKPALVALLGRLLDRLPFQNIDMLARPRRAPTLAEIRSDMLEGRGGPCGHMNPFLAALLHELGYAVSLVAANMQAPDCHVALLVDIEGERLWMDVGNGFPYLEPIPLGDEHPRSHPLLDHRLRSLGDSRWQIEHRRRGQLEWSRNYDFGLAPRSFDSFAEMIEAHYSRPGYGPFLLGLRAIRFPPCRAIVLRDRVLRLVDAERDESHSLDDDGLAAALREHFAASKLPLQQALDHLEMPP
jgi:arylamine N-acetyltransferase